MGFARLIKKNNHRTPVAVNPDNVVLVEPLPGGGTMITTNASKGDGVFFFSVEEDIDVVTGILEQAQRR